MNDSGDTKICPMCAETIKSAAKLCPHCGHRQRRFEYLKRELTAGIAIALLLVLCILLLQWRFPDDRELEAARKFQLHGRGDLAVVNYALTALDSKRNLWLTGMVTNSGNRSWRIHELEVRMSDSKGDLVDAQHHRFKKGDAFVVQPGHEHAFGIRLEPQAVAATNLSMLVRVQHATDGRDSYDPD